MQNLLLAKPIVYQINDDNNSIDSFEKDLQIRASENVQDIILKYPTVYIHSWKDREEYEVYIGESNNIVQRTKQHYANAKNNNAWQHLLIKNKARLYIIGHEHFNKSLTLDIENRLMLYMMSIEKVKKIYNQKRNPQNKYYTEDEFDDIFESIWRNLRRKDSNLFLSESAIKDSAIYKASPLHKLTEDQEEAKELIVKKVFESLNQNNENQLIFIEGEAGTGKTVLNSSAFYEMFIKAEEENIENFKCALMVNHDEQITVYEQIAQKLGLTEKNGEVVCKPTRFINMYDKEHKIDVAFVDEAHLLLTQGKQSYQGKNQLQDIIDRAKVTIIMFDENQILTTEQYWEAQILDYYKYMAKKDNNYIELKKQLRISADKKTIRWIDMFTKERKLEKIPEDSHGYEIKIFSSPEELDEIIHEKAKNKDTELSRLVATYDWEYSAIHKPKDGSKYWKVVIDNWNKPWNRELEKDLDKNERKKIKNLSWAEQPQTIDEIGSTFTIQGFDLNYVGVILGPSVKYRNGKIVFDTKASCNSKAIRNRTLEDGTKQEFGEELIQNEVRVLMTRGVKGLYIYACDNELRQALLAANRQLCILGV